MLYKNVADNKAIKNVRDCIKDNRKKNDCERRSSVCNRVSPAEIIFRHYSAWDYCILQILIKYVRQKMYIHYTCMSTQAQRQSIHTLSVVLVTNIHWATNKLLKFLDHNKNFVEAANRITNNFINNLRENIMFVIFNKFVWMYFENSIRTPLHFI